MSYIDCHICLELGVEEAAAPDVYICARHWDRIDQLLAEILAMYKHAQDPLFLITTSEPASDYTKSRPPCALWPLIVTDIRSQVQEADDPVSAPRVMTAWHHAVNEAQGFKPGANPPSFHHAVWGLRQALPWIVRQPAVVRFARHVAATHDSLRRATNYA